LHQVILADEPRSDMFIASQSLEDGSRNSGGGFIVTETDILPDAIKREAIPQDTLDNLIPRDVHVNFIKADIEGAEFLAMRGAERILRDGAPIILSEVHVDQLFKISKKTWREYFDFMHGFGYRAHFIEHGELAGEASDLQAGKVYNVAFVRP
jgi:hypothetical protein